MSAICIAATVIFWLWGLSLARTIAPSAPPWSVGYYEFEEREIEVREGSLAIHIFDVDGKKAVFSTTGTKRLGKKDTPEGIAEISPAVKALLAEFPPS